MAKPFLKWAGGDSVDKMNMVYGIMFETKEEAQEFIDAWKKSMGLRIKHGGIHTMYAFNNDGSVEFRIIPLDSEPITHVFAEEFVRCLNVLLKHYSADDVAKGLLTEGEEEK